MANVGELYQSAVGKTFHGKVVDHHNIRNGKVWTVIEITSVGSSLERILEKIYDKGEGKVWKGFTGPPDFDNYRLWVEVKAEEGTTKKFTVTKYKGPFRVDDLSYSRREGYCFIVE